MGIRGLTTYINRNPDFFESYALHGGYLVIDGHSLAAQLYISSRCNCAFGGDHDVYARRVDEFFDELDECEVTPLVILDGGMESKKMKTTYARMTEKLRSATSYTPASQSQTKFMPMSMTTVFESTLRKRGVKLARTVLEADSDIAGVAKILDAPVLSYDSDFYVFGSKYIPINTLEPCVVKESSGRGYAKRCKIFRIERFLKTFPGLDSSALPLAAVLLGNDYVNCAVFKNFFDCLKLANHNRRLHNEGQRRIHTTLRWLRNYNLNDAVAAILSKLPRKRRRKVLDTIELIVNGYLELPCEALVPLGFAKEYRDATTRRGRFEFQGDIDSLESRRLWRDDHEARASSSTDESEDETSPMDDLSRDREDVDKIDDNWPDWFKDRHAKGDFPAYFVDMLHRRVFAVPVQIEDFKYPCACAMSLKIVGVIDGLLLAGRDQSDVGLTCVIREGTNFIRRRFETIRATETTKFPSLDDLDDAPVTLKKRIIDDTLEITGKERLVEDMPPEWRLYVATIVYWMSRSDEPLRDSCHVYALLLAMLLGVIDNKIGYHRSLHAYERTLRKSSTTPESRRGSDDETRAETIIEALRTVTENDCLRAAPFFIANFTMDRQLCECPRKFKSTIVHVFSQFQSCLRHAVHLNTLLGFPYESPIIADLYNGTLLYNLYVNFRKRANVEAYVGVVLENSPSLLRLFDLLTGRLREIIDGAPADGNRGRGVKRRKNKKKTKNEDPECKPMSEEDTQSTEIQSHFVDKQNSFSILGISA